MADQPASYGEQSYEFGFRISDSGGTCYEIVNPHRFKKTRIEVNRRAAQCHHLTKVAVVERIDCVESKSRGQYPIDCGRAAAVHSHCRRTVVRASFRFVGRSPTPMHCPDSRESTWPNASASPCRGATYLEGKRSLGHHHDRRIVTGEIDAQ